MRIRGFGRLQRFARSISNIFVRQAIILLYHRVIELPSDPQLLSVSPRNFAEQLEVIRGYGQTIQVKALGQALQSGNRGRLVVVVTFDDGYADNLFHAKPLLERYDVGATVFVTTGYLGSETDFWHDELERMFLHNGPLPATLRLKVKERRYQWELGSAADGGEETYTNFREWNVSRKDNPTVRHGLYRSICELLRPLPDAERQKVLQSLAGWAGTAITSRPTHRTLLPEELLRLADGGLVEIGSHTVSHPVLSELPLVIQKEEISRSKARLDEILEDPVTSFAYPFGGRSHYTEQTVTAVREAGFEWACSNFPGMVSPSTDPWQLPRFLVRDWDGDQFARNLKGWIRDA